MGGKQLEIINSANGEVINTKLVQNGENSSGMTALLSTASTTMQQVNILLTEFNKPNGFYSQVQSAFNETKTTFTKVNEVLDGSKTNLNSALKQISSSAEQLSQLISVNRPKVDNLMNMSPGLIQKTQATLDSLQAASTALQQVVNELNSGKGTLPSLINDDRLYKNLIDSSDNLDSLLIDVKKHPSRYFKVKVF
jgi:phospholipid/cholesterol/gamma-HCH transport system substrate-binding protein